MSDRCHSFPHHSQPSDDSVFDGAAPCTDEAEAAGLAAATTASALDFDSDDANGTDYQTVASKPRPILVTVKPIQGRRPSRPKMQKHRR